MVVFKFLEKLKSKIQECGKSISRRLDEKFKSVYRIIIAS